jgi:hypothetical protein
VLAHWNLGLNLRWEHDGDGPFANLNLFNLADARTAIPPTR